jgi:Trp operon repressor
MENKGFESNHFEANMRFLEQAKDGTEFERILKILTVPSKSGIYISRYDIIELGKSLGVQIPVRERKEMLKDLFIYAKQMDNLKEFINIIISFVDHRIVQYRELQENYPRSSVLIEEWVKKAKSLRSFLENMKKEVDIYRNI